MSNIDVNKIEVIDTLLMDMYTPEKMDLITSLPHDEIREEVRQHGMDVDVITTLTCLRMETVAGTECKIDETSKLVDDNTFIRDEPLRDLLDILGKLGRGNSEWLSQICSSPIEIVAWFQGAETMEDFYSRNKLDNPIEKVFEFQFLVVFAQGVEENHA